MLELHAYSTSIYIIIEVSKMVYHNCLIGFNAHNYIHSKLNKILQHLKQQNKTILKVKILAVYGIKVYKNKQNVTVLSFQCTNCFINF